jgi:alpha-1,2-mannosyltransferase
LDVLEVTPSRWRGVFIGVAAANKLTPLLFVIYLVVVGRRRDAARAVGTFVASGAVAALLLPADSLRFWTRMIYTTARIGDLASLGNQSLQALLNRAGVDYEDRPIVWGILVVAISGLALWQDGAVERDGRRAHTQPSWSAARTIAASPVSWTHHQVWTVLAGMLLVAAPTAGAPGGRGVPAGGDDAQRGRCSVRTHSHTGPAVPVRQRPRPGRGGWCAASASVLPFVSTAPSSNALRARPSGSSAPGSLVWLCSLCCPCRPAVIPACTSIRPKKLGSFGRKPPSRATTDPCDETYGGLLLMNYSVDPTANVQWLTVFVSTKVARRAMRTAPGAPQTPPADHGSR